MKLINNQRRWREVNEVGRKRSRKPHKMCERESSVEQTGESRER